MNCDRWTVGWLLPLLVCLTPAPAADALIRVRADQPGPAVSRHVTGACIEDVNHEIYGGISSQMVFGESFAEPPASSVQGFESHGGTWTVVDDTIQAAAGDGPKLVSGSSPTNLGPVHVEVRFRDREPGLAGLILKVREAGLGADHFTGYEVSLDPSRQVVVLGRHRQNWEPIREAACPVPVGQWIRLGVILTQNGFQVWVDGKRVAEHDDEPAVALRSGSVGLRTWRKPAEFRALRVGGLDIPARRVDPQRAGGVSGMWRVVDLGESNSRFRLETDRPFVGTQSQRITSNANIQGGVVGIENRGLNRQGMTFQAGRLYEGAVWLRADDPTEVRVALRSINKPVELASATIRVQSREWTHYPFELVPDREEFAGSLWMTLPKLGDVVVGHVRLEPGPWGRFHGLPTRLDVANKMVESGLTVLRLGGLMANAEGYRWKNQVGPRDRRPPYPGYWYPQSSNGWGIFEFLDLCEAAGFLPVVDLNLDETPADLRDFLEYCNGPVTTPWGRKRAENGHPAPYHLRHVELGNEEAVDDSYWRRFRPLAEAAWAADPSVILIVGDFEYRNPITDPDHVTGAPRITSLAAHRQILDLAKQQGRPVWFDVHIWNDRPGDAPGRIAALQTFDAALGRLSPGADYRVCVLEENANNHTVRRAVAHGETLNGLMALGDRVSIVCAANALQPDGQNDNGWDQGLVFLNPNRAWLQPPALVSRLVAANLQTRLVPSAVEGSGGSGLSVVATRAEDGSTVSVQVTNTTDQPRAARVALDGFTMKRPQVHVEELTGDWTDRNTADQPTGVSPHRHVWEPAGGVPWTFPPRSFTVLRFE